MSGISVSGVRGWTTTKANGSFGLGGEEPVGVVMERWAALQGELASIGADRLASAVQVHGNSVSTHRAGWTGWLRQRGIDGHITDVRGTALSVTVADCTPVFIAHPRAIALLHAGWRGTASLILKVGFEALLALGCPADECEVHLGPSICGKCYEVGPEVFEAITGKSTPAKGFLDVRSVLSQQAVSFGVRKIDTSRWCTRCENERFYSHRGGDSGRQLGVMALV